MQVLFESRDPQGAQWRERRRAPAALRAAPAHLAGAACPRAAVRRERPARRRRQAMPRRAEDRQRRHRGRHRDGARLACRAGHGAGPVGAHAGARVAARPARRSARRAPPSSAEPRRRACFASSLAHWSRRHAFATPATVLRPPRASSRWPCWPTATCASPSWRHAAPHGAHAQLGLSPAEIAYGGARPVPGPARLQRHGLGRQQPGRPPHAGRLLAEVQDPQLQLKVLQLCVAVVETDEHVAEGESAVLAAALAQWGLPQAWLADRLRSRPCRTLERRAAPAAAR